MIDAKILTWGVMALTLAGCGSKPSCSSNEAKDIVTQIARENKSLVSNIKYNGNEPSVAPEPETCEQNTECQIALNNFNNIKIAAVDVIQKCHAINIIYKHSEFLDQCPNITESGIGIMSNDDWGSRGYSGKPDSPRKIFMDKYGDPIREKWIKAEEALNLVKRKIDESNRKKRKEAWQNALQEITYDLNNIILTEKNKDTGSVSCKAELNADVPGWGSANKNITYTVEKTSEGELYATVWGLRY